MIRSRRLCLYPERRWMDGDEVMATASSVVGVEPVDVDDAVEALEGYGWEFSPYRCNVVIERRAILQYRRSACIDQFEEGLLALM
jgi:hypothetical protein